MQVRPLAFVLAAALAVPASAAPAARSFDLVTYAAPDGFTVQEAPGHVAITRIGAKSYCIIGIYRGTDAAASLDASFASEWNDIVGHSVDPVAVPASQHGTIAGADALIGAAMTTTGGKPVLATLATIDAGAKVVSIVVLTPGPDDLKVYTPSIQALLASLTVQRVAPAAAPPPDAPAAPAAPAAAAVDPSEAPPPSRPLTIGDLAGEWGYGAGFSNTYVDSSSGVYAGYTGAESATRYTITAKGAITTDYRTASASSSGAYGTKDTLVGKITVAADGEVVITNKGHEANAEHYLVRGWLVTRDATFLRVIGPFYGPVPDEDRQDPHKGRNLEQVWIRKTVKGK